MDRLYEYFIKLLQETSSEMFRYIYTDINWDSRMIGIIGPRGVGKTTMVLQHMKMTSNTKDTLYVTADDFYFADNRLVDFADSFVKQGGKYLFIDEIHKYKDWSKELKLIYDYHSDLKIVFTGSSVLDIKKGVADLSRRVVMYHLQGLSFREYLLVFHNISTDIYSLEDILAHKVKIEGLERPLPLFQDYLRHGYYPFALESDFGIRLRQIINQTLESDIPLYAEMNTATGRKLKQLLAIISKSVPFKPNFTSMAATLSASRNNIADYCLYIEDAGMISQLRDNTGGIKGLGKVEKIYLDNTNLVYSLAEDKPNIGSLQKTFFFNQTRVRHPVTSSKFFDFKINDMDFEIGGRNKGQKQLGNTGKGFVVKDDIEVGYRNVIPLWQFGLLY